MSFSIATWNVNSLRVRLPHLADWLGANSIDIVALQETKLPDDGFPHDEISAMGYQAVVSGQKTYNGVALLTRTAVTDVITDIPGFEDPQRRVLAATVGATRVVNLYVPNGQAVGAEKFVYKLRWLAALTDYLRGAVIIPPNARKGVEGHLYAGAKQATLIDGYEAKLGIAQFDRMIDWGWFYFITKPLFKLMDWITGLVHNFGITILILTVLVKAAFFPIANKQYESMARMKKRQPEMLRITEGDKDDPQRQQKETFELYRKEKINPLAGCWPILLQIPVFFALYKVLFVTIDMRHAPFYGYLKDLSAADPTSIFNLFGLLPFTPPELLHVGFLPLLMGITMWIQMQLNPPQPDPVQQQIFSFMPLIFTFLLATFPAGLVLYWAWSNILSIIQQYAINKKNGAETHLIANMKRTFAPLLRLFGAKGETK